MVYTVHYCWLFSKEYHSFWTDFLPSREQVVSIYCNGVLKSYCGDVKLFFRKVILQTEHLASCICASVLLIDVTLVVVVQWAGYALKTILWVIKEALTSVKRSRLNIHCVNGLSISRELWKFLFILGIMKINGFLEDQLWKIHLKMY